MSDAIDLAGSLSNVDVKDNVVHDAYEVAAALAERERCAKIADAFAASLTDAGVFVKAGARLAAETIAIRIRSGA